MKQKGSSKISHVRGDYMKTKTKCDHRRKRRTIPGTERSSQVHLDES